MQTAVGSVKGAQEKCEDKSDETMTTSDDRFLTTENFEKFFEVYFFYLGLNQQAYI